MATLKDINAHVLVPHCLAFMEQVHKQCRATHVAKALFQMFEQTLSDVLTTVWHQLLLENDDELPDLSDRTVDQFKWMIRYFIAEPITEEDQHNLAMQL